jgi:glutamine---fructose-6-phosphate transaminase (isomerizing)
MCGISVIISKKQNNIIDLILKSLAIIQNRGYDSVGIAMKSKDWLIYKYASSEISDCMDNLFSTMKNKESNIAIGHTRWATHGGKTDNNSHPHYSMRKNIILVHNGIINNFQEIKEFLLKKNYKFYSETDTEIIANLIEYYLMENKSIEQSIKLSTDLLQGTWALAIVYTLEPDKVYLTRHGSPLILGHNDNVIICTSEISGFIGLINSYIILENNDIISIDNTGYKSNNIYISKNIDNIILQDSPDPYPYWTIKEIYEQPKTILAAFNNGARINNNNIILGGLYNLSNIIRTNSIEHLILLGCGTSYHACMLSKIYFNTSNVFNTIQAYDASEFTENDIPKRGKTLCICCSQSGETRDLIKSIHICKSKTCILLGCINVVDSVIALEVDCGVYLNAGQEIAVASTKSFTSTIVILSLICMWFKEKHLNIPIINTLRCLPNSIEKLLDSQDLKNSCSNIVKFINNNKIHSIFILGREKLFPVAKEIALKIKEIAYIHAEGYPSGSLKHGPFALLDKNTLTILLIDKKNQETLTSTFYEISSRNTHLCIVSDISDSNLNCELKLELPRINHYQEIVFTIALQYLTYLLSTSRNINPDKPRNLAKVVTVE